MRQEHLAEIFLLFTRVCMTTLNTTTQKKLLVLAADISANTRFQPSVDMSWVI